MRVQMPFRPGNDIGLLAESGATEVYMGYISEEWNSRFGPENDLNRMSGFGSQSNFMRFEDARYTMGLCKGHDMKVFVTLNALSYSDEEADFVLRECESIEEAGFDGLILGDLGLIKVACEAGYNVIVSTIATVYNSESAAYFRDLGANRIVLPRDLTLYDMAGIIRDVPMEYEAFIMQAGCRYGDGFCTCDHGTGAKTICSTLHFRNKEWLIPDNSLNAVLHNNYLFDNVFHKEACGLCSIYKLMEIGVGTLKVAGRSNSQEINLRCCKAVSDNIRISETCSSHDEYLEKMVIPFDIEAICHGLNCYY